MLLKIYEPPNLNFRRNQDSPSEMVFLKTHPLSISKDNHKRSLAPLGAFVFILRRNSGRRARQIFVEFAF